MRRFLVLGVLLLAGGGWLLGWSPYLRVEQIAVVGLAPRSPLSEERILQQANLEIGMPMARVSEAAARRSLLRIPRVAEVDLVRTWPRTVEVRITERTPWALVRTPAGVTFVDEGGAFFAKAGPSAASIPEVRLPRRDSRLVRDLVVVTRALPASLVVSGMSATSSTELTVELLQEQGVLTVVWGDISETPLKTRVLLQLLEKKKATSWSRIDLSAPRAPTTRE